MHGDALLDNISPRWISTRNSMGRSGGKPAVLDLDCAPHLVDHTAKFDEEPVAGALDHAGVTYGDGRSMSMWSLRSARSRARACRPIRLGSLTSRNKIVYRAARRATLLVKCI